jgi:general secretion pathway protein F
MILFHYRAADGHGRTQHGSIQASDKREALQQLQTQRLYVLELSESALKRPASGFWPGRLGLSELHQQQIVEQLGTLLKAGLPLDRALAIVSELPESSTARERISQVRHAVREGGSLSQALASHIEGMAPVALNLIRAGEAAGTLPQNLLQAAAYLAQGARLKGKVLNALIYPSILMGTVLVAVLFLILAVVPQFQALFTSLGASLPWYTQALLMLSDGLSRYGPFLLMGMAIVLVIVVRQWQRPHVRLRWDARLLKVPVIGPLWQKAEVARFSASLSVMLGQGVPMLNALSHSGAVMQNRKLRESVETARASVKDGQGLAHSLSQTSGFPHMALQMMQAGEDSGQLPTMLAEIAAAYELQTDQASTRLLAVLVPALTLLMTVLVALVILAVLLPVYDLTGSLDIA